MFTKTGKKGEEKMQKRKTAETTERVERERERELCLGKTGRVFCAQKLEKTGKTFNIKKVVSPVIKLGYLEMTQAF